MLTVALFLAGYQMETIYMFINSRVDIKLAYISK